MELSMIAPCIILTEYLMEPSQFYKNIYYIFMCELQICFKQILLTRLCVTTKALPDVV